MYEAALIDVSVDIDVHVATHDCGMCICSATFFLLANVLHGFLLAIRGLVYAAKMGK